MNFTSENSDDIKKYYLNTFIKIKETGDTLYHVTRVDRTQVSGNCEDGSEFVIYLDNENPFEIDYVLPHKSFFQHGKDALQLFRVPARQYQRGLNSQNTSIGKLNAVGEREAAGHLDFAVLKAFVAKQPFVTLTQATAKANPDGLRSWVLTPRMIYHKATRAIYMDFTRIAEVDDKRNIFMKQSIFKSEIQEFLKQNNEEFVIHA